MQPRQIPFLVFILSLIPLFHGMGQTFASPTDSDSASPDLSPDQNLIVITAQPSPQPIQTSGRAITVLDSSTLTDEPRILVSDHLEHLPSVGLVRSGATGGLVSLHTRGSSPGNTLVVLDGIPLNDPSSPDRSFDFGLLDAFSTSRIELLEGPQSVLYGPDATGGVVHLSSFLPHMSAETRVCLLAGSAYTFMEGIKHLSPPAKVRPYLSALRLDRAGISQAVASHGGAERDGVHHTHITAGMAWDLSETSASTTLIHFLDTDSDLDSFVSGRFSDADHVRITRTQLHASNQTEHAFLQDRLRATTQLGAHLLDRLYHDGPNRASYRFEASNFTAATTLAYALPKRIHLTLRLDGNRERSESTLNAGDRQVHSVYRLGAALSVRIDRFSHIHPSTGIRVDRHPRYGNTITSQSALALGPWQPLRTSLLELFARLSFGSAFKSPSLSQLFDPQFGNTNLKPETTQTLDGAVTFSLFRSRLQVSPGFFYSWVSERFGYDPQTFQTLNHGRASIWGADLHTRYSLDRFVCDVRYSYLNTRDHETKTDLPRRPHHRIVLTLEGRPLLSLTTRLLWNFTGSRYDLVGDVTRMKAYHRLDAEAAWHIANHVTLNARVENLFDADYEEVRGYQTSGLGAYLSLGVSL